MKHLPVEVAHGLHAVIDVGPELSNRVVEVLLGFLFLAAQLFFLLLLLLLITIYLLYVKDLLWFLEVMRVVGLSCFTGPNGTYHGDSLIELLEVMVEVPRFRSELNQVVMDYLANGFITLPSIP